MPRTKRKKVAEKPDTRARCQFCRQPADLLHTVHEWLGRIRETYHLCVECADSRRTLYQDVEHAPNRAARRQMLQQWARQERHQARWGGANPYAVRTIRRPATAAAGKAA